MSAHHIIVSNVVLGLQKKIQAYRRSEGLRPYLPWPEDREKIKQEYMEKFHRRTPQQSSNAT